MGAIKLRRVVSNIVHTVCRVGSAGVPATPSRDGRCDGIIECRNVEITSQQPRRVVGIEIEI